MSWNTIPPMKCKYGNGWYWVRHIRYDSPPEIAHLLYGDIYTTFMPIGNGTPVEEYEILSEQLTYPQAGVEA